MADQRVVYQFPISHYCEKTRWQLDHKELGYATRNLLPGGHRLFSQLRAGVGTLPVLRDGKRLIGDSTRIAYYLEKHYPQVPLLPEESAQRRQVIELEQQFDRYGVHVRRWLYGQLLGRPEVMRAMLAPYALPGLVKKGLAPVIERGVAQLYRVSPEPVAQSQVRLEQGLALIESLIKGDPARYLVGDVLTLADITAAALYAPLLSPAGSPWGFVDETSLPRPVQAVLQGYRERPAGQWLLARYRYDR
ncbi:glutathione S-transferase family protein [Alcanivorax quisquiliarum]|uniref:Glutathione S-transferase family protein n=1 Tax=Alcanivorax quisquiliarum TaxID=2933565 RepID=A0ABT0EA78_9GAMM|nr:glutathione S-transferase family protein [Alcanivorax quisquiliarum]MCK0538638.1 glutathione S-transferase family protein [Alcanivorax quisquiliarum]